MDKSNSRSGIETPAWVKQMEREYERGTAYKNRLGMYDAVKTAENFYEGRQWEGLKTQAIKPLTMNFIRRLITYFIAMVVSDDISNELRPYRNSPEIEMQVKALSKSIDRVIERAKLTDLGREALRDAAVDGDACLYFWFDADAPTGRMGVQGEIEAELIMNTNVIFGNPSSGDVQKQPYILIVQRLPVEQVRAEARAAGLDFESIMPDADSNYKGEDETASTEHLVTVKTRFWKGDDRMVRFARTAGGVALKDETETGLTRYPIAYWSWLPRKNSCHGVRLMDELIHTQITINQIWTAISMHIQNAALGKMIYNRQKFPNGWDSTPGKAIGVIGDPRDSIAAQMQGVPLPNQITDVVDLMISTARDFAGASDAALGNVKPENTSAILAVQKASSAPLELQRMGFYRFVEDYIRVLLDMMHAYYGVREIQIEDDTEPVMVDFGAMEPDALDLKVEVGAASYWSELTQIANADSLLEKGIIQDPIDYLEAIPDGLIKNKANLIKTIKENYAAQGMGIQPEAGGMAGLPAEAAMM